MCLKTNITFMHRRAPGGGQRGKVYPVWENQGPPPEEKKRPHPQKARRPPTKIWPNFHLYPGQNLHEKHILKFFTADLRRQLANDRCNSLAFFSLVMTLPWLCGTSDERRATQPFFGCFVLLWIFWRRCGTSDDRHATLLRKLFWANLYSQYGL